MGSSITHSLIHSFTHSRSELLHRSWHLSLCRDTLVSKAKSFSSRHLPSRGSWNAFNVCLRSCMFCSSYKEPQSFYTGSYTEKLGLEKLMSNREVRARQEAGNHVWKCILRTFTVVARGSIPAGELRSRKLHGAARKKKVYSSARAAITKHHKVGGLNDGNVSPHRILEARIKKIKVLAGLVPSEGGEGEPTPRVSPGFWSFAGNLWHFLVCGSITPIFTWHFSPRVPFPFFIRTPSHTGLGPTLMTSF